MTKVKVCKIGIKYILLKCKIMKTNHLAKMKRNNIENRPCYCHWIYHELSDFQIMGLERSEEREREE